MRPDALERRFCAALQAAADPAVGAALLAARFGVALDGGPVPWCWPALRRLWAALAALPPGAVRRNPALRRIVRVPGHGCGAYRGAATRSPFGPGTVEIGVHRFGPRSRAYPVPLDEVGAMVRHEIGHAVAVCLGLYDTLYEAVPHSPWLFQGDRAALLRRLLGDDPALLRLGDLYLRQAPGRRSLTRALELLRQEQQRRGRRPLPRSALRLPAVRHLQNSRAALPCYAPLRPLPDGHLYLYDSGYGRGFVLRAADLGRTRVSLYQARSPNEWFAELFTVHYAECGRPGQLLRRRGRPLRRIADWLDAQLTRLA